MNTRRRTRLMIGATLLIVALVVVLVITPSGRAHRGIRPDGGMGELRRFEAQQASQNTEALFSDHPYIGMGDLRYFEYLQETSQNSGELFSDHPYIGMGDLRYFEYLQPTLYPEMNDAVSP